MYKVKHPKIRSISSGTGKEKPIKKPKQKYCKRCNKEVSKPGKYCTRKCENEVAKEKREKVREKKRESVTSLKKKLWKLISEYIRRKYANSDGESSCVTCGDTKHWKELQAGHFVPSGSSSYLRYVENNIHPQCYHCNINLGSNPIEYRIFMENHYGKDFVDAMIELRREERSLKPYDLNILIDEYKKKLSNL